MTTDHTEVAESFRPILATVSKVIYCGFPFVRCQFCLRRSTHVRSSPYTRCQHCLHFQTLLASREDKTYSKDTSLKTEIIIIPYVGISSLFCGVGGGGRRGIAPPFFKFCDVTLIIGLCRQLKRHSHAGKVYTRARRRKSQRSFLGLLTVYLGEGPR